MLVLCLPLAALRLRVRNLLATPPVFLQIKEYVEPWVVSLGQTHARVKVMCLSVLQPTFDLIFDMASSWIVYRQYYWKLPTMPSQATMYYIIQKFTIKFWGQRYDTWLLLWNNIFPILNSVSNFLIVQKVSYLNAWWLIVVYKQKSG